MVKWHSYSQLFAINHYAKPHLLLLPNERRLKAIWHQNVHPVRSNLRTPRNNNGFDYRQHLAHQEIFTILQDAEVEEHQLDQGNSFLHFLSSIEEKTQQTINRLLPQPQAAILSGILLGNEQAIPSKLREAFRATGMTHIIAISGFRTMISRNKGLHEIGKG